MRAIPIYLWLGNLFILLFPLASQAKNMDPKIPFEKYRLDNGLEVILHQDRKLPLVAVSVWYHVAAGDEVKGKSGFAHLFEHMLFQGSEHVGEDRHFAILKEIGASASNGSTNFNRTNYYEVVPSHMIETALWLESDRMNWLLPMLNRKSLDNQIEVVRNERRQRTDNVPYGKSSMKLFELLYPQDHPYHYRIIGDHQDLANATLDDVIDFYKTWYVPANATLGLAGNFEIEEAKRLVQKWFGSLPKSPVPDHKMLPTPKVQRHREVLVDQFAKLRQLTYAWHIPARYEPGEAELDIASDILTSESGRLFRILVHEKELARSVESYAWGNQMSGLFNLTVTLKPEASLKEVERIIDQELSQLSKTPPTAAEVQRAVTNTESSYVWNLESLLSRIETLQSYNHFVGSPDFVSKDLDRFRASTPKAVQKAVAKYLPRQSRIEVLTLVKQAH